MSSIALVWFTTDLRLHDNAVLAEALKNHSFVIPVYCLDYQTSLSDAVDNTTGTMKMGLARRIFLYQSLLDLDINLKAKGSKLMVLDIRNLAFFAKSVGASAVCAAHQIAAEELAQYQNAEKALALSHIKLELRENNSLYDVSDLGFEVHNLPDIFTQFRKKTENIAPIQAALPTPIHIASIQTNDLALAQCVELCPQTFGLTDLEAAKQLRFSGGETSGLARLQTYFWQTDYIQTYKQTRNGLLISQDYSSKFSPWLALGCLSVRYIYMQLITYEKDRTANESTYWLYFELLWREYFRLVAQKYGHKIFIKNGLRNNSQSSSKSIKPNIAYIKKWINGQTGIPFIDANMIELAQTGYMSNRGRQNVASFFVHELGQNWQIGARYFESQLIDYDVQSNYGNWQYVAGVGNDPRPNRHFNILRQARMYDPNGAFVRYWIPELSDLPIDIVQTPWKSKIVIDYPKPLILLEDKN